MSEHQAQRTLVKSPPELWAEVSDPESLGRRLDALGEIAITRAEPETTVAWEGENVSGTVALEPSGWGTKVTITAQLEVPEPAGEPRVEAEPEPEAEAPAEPVAAPEPEPQPVQSGGFFARLFGSAPEPEPVKPPEVEPTVTAEEPEAAPSAPAEEPALDGEALDAALEAALDSLGAAHHRPFSRS